MRDFPFSARLPFVVSCGRNKTPFTADEISKGWFLGQGFGPRVDGFNFWVMNFCPLRDEPPVHVGGFCHIALESDDGVRHSRAGVKTWRVILK